jgi:hypothetical protein
MCRAKVRVKVEVIVKVKVIVSPQSTTPAAVSGLRRIRAMAGVGLDPIRESAKERSSAGKTKRVKLPVIHIYSLILLQYAVHPQLNRRLKGKRIRPSVIYIYS